MACSSLLSRAALRSSEACNPWAVAVAILAALALIVSVSRPVTDASVTSGLRGLVTISGCPGPERPGERCSHAFKGAEINVLRLPSARFVRTFRSGARGRFRVRLTPGRYRLEPQNSGIARAVPVPVRVRARRFRYVHIDYDNGLR